MNTRRERDLKQAKKQFDLKFWGLIPNEAELVAQQQQAPVDLPGRQGQPGGQGQGHTGDKVAPGGKLCTGVLWVGLVDSWFCWS